MPDAPPGGGVHGREEAKCRLTFACPRCGYEVDRASAVGYAGAEIRPRPGDISLCLKCAAPLELLADAAPRWLTFGEVSHLPPATRAEIVSVMLHLLTLRPPASPESWRRPKK